MTPFTLVLAYYDNPTMLQHQVRTWRSLPAELRAQLHVVVVDDGSPRVPALAAVTAGNLAGWADELASVQLWRMGVDVRWNQDACRNIGVREAATKWVLLTDMDHVVPVQTWRRLMLGKLTKSKVYRFSRVTAPELTPYKPHPNSWALTRKLYWKAGGYDEALAGNYGTDGDFLIRVRQVAECIELPDVLVRYPREVIADASTTTLERKRPDEKDAIRRIVRARTADWRPLHFSFPCERLL
jgi:hypothetical protein